MNKGKSSLLPPKIPLSSISSSYTEYIPVSAMKPRNSNPHHHQRTSSESCLIDEYPSWIDKLLDEPEMPVLSRTHCRSSSDSFTYVGPTEKEANKRGKQQCAKRSRVRRGQYIAELERNVQALQAEGFEFASKMEFVYQQNLNLSMENEALKQCLEDLTQKQLVKCVEYELLEREVGRLRALYQHQQQMLPQRDLDHRFSNISLNFSE